MILSIDPGAKKAGAAMFRDGQLVSAWLSRGTDWVSTASNVRAKARFGHKDELSVVVIEKMQHYPESPVPVEDLITLSLMAGRVTGFYPEAGVVEYFPRTWKGQVPKKIMLSRIKEKLSAVEIARVRDATHHDVWDAVGLGLYYLRSKGLRVENLRHV